MRFPGHRRRLSRRRSPSARAAIPPVPSSDETATAPRNRSRGGCRGRGLVRLFGHERRLAARRTGRKTGPVLVSSESRTTVSHEGDRNSMDGHTGDCRRITSNSRRYLHLRGQVWWRECGGRMDGVRGGHGARLERMGDLPCDGLAPTRGSKLDVSAIAREESASRGPRVAGRRLWCDRTDGQRGLTSCPTPASAPLCPGRRE